MWSAVRGITLKVTLKRRDLVVYPDPFIEEQKSAPNQLKFLTILTRL